MNSQQAICSVVANPVTRTDEKLQHTEVIANGQRVRLQPDATVFGQGVGTEPAEGGAGEAG